MPPNWISHLVRNHSKVHNQNHPQHHHTPPQPTNPQRLEQPPATQQDRPLQNPKQQPPYRTSQDNPQQQRQSRAGQHPRSPRRQTAEEPNPPNRGQRPSAGRRQVESGSAAKGPPRHNNAQGPTDQCRPPPVSRDMPARGGGNSANNRSHHNQSQFRDGHDYNEAYLGRGNVGLRQEEMGGEQNPPPREN
ncbi:uncharacterized protein LOC133825310 [Humulus lupulus]|uniref:uncharacterized protein LOC133825310 n=1 Tax=Humulus lupulus TaxID=3486 RepID=UPI002B413D1F|nr:uncharacterized protein LOC133825310 [Humulus lupulus]